MYSNAANAPFYVGASTDGSGQWKWIDNSLLSFTNWNAGQPTSNNVCMQLLSSGKWTASSQWCSSIAKYICQKEG